MTRQHVDVDQFVQAPPRRVWQLLTDPELIGRWWAPGPIAAVVGHRFNLLMPTWGPTPCEVLMVDEPRRFVYSFNERWTLDWQLSPEGSGTRLLLRHDGFDLDLPQDRYAFENMGPGWRTTVLPRLATQGELLTGPGR